MSYLKNLLLCVRDNIYLVKYITIFDKMFIVDTLDSIRLNLDSFVVNYIIIRMFQLLILVYWLNYYIVIILLEILIVRMKRKLIKIEKLTDEYRQNCIRTN